jgi:hypothetical protein
MESERPASIETQEIRRPVGGGTSGRARTTDADTGIIRWRFQLLVIPDGCPAAKAKGIPVAEARYATWSHRFL